MAGAAGNFIAALPDGVRGGPGAPLALGEAGGRRRKMGSGGGAEHASDRLAGLQRPVTTTLQRRHAPPSCRSRPTAARAYHGLAVPGPGPAPARARSSRPRAPWFQGVRDETAGAGWWWPPRPPPGPSLCCAHAGGGVWLWVNKVWVHRHTGADSTPDPGRARGRFLRASSRLASGGCVPTGSDFVDDRRQRFVLAAKSRDPTADPPAPSLSTVATGTDGA